MDIVSTQKFIKTSPRKLREVVPLAKGLTPQEALQRLPFARKKAVEPLVKAIKTAIANAKDRGLDVQSLEFKEIQIGEGPMLKRFRAGARGRAKPYKRKMSHIRVVLAVNEKSKVSSTKTQTKSKIISTKGKQK